MASASAVLFVIMFSAIFGLGSAAQNRNMASQSTGPAPTPLPVCIDDSDCEKLREGNKYACFQVLQKRNPPVGLRFAFEMAIFPIYVHIREKA